MCPRCGATRGVALLARSLTDALAPAGMSKIGSTETAPESANSADGVTRSMCAMALFDQAKAEYQTLPDIWADTEERRALHRKYGQECFKFCVTHGGVYIKASQFVGSLQGGAADATIPREYLEALRPLTDSVPTRPFGEVSRVAEEDLGKPLKDLVESVSETAIAAASLAQVHKGVAKVRGVSTPVAIKLQYPNLPEQVAADFMSLRMMSQMMQSPNYDLGWLIDDIEKYVTSELDFGREADHGRAARAALSSLAPGVLVPEVVRELSSPRILATEFVEGLVRLDDAPALRERGLEPYDVGQLVSSAFPELALVNGLVHGDPHAGNVYCRNADGKPGGPAQLVILDHGLYHKLTDSDRLGICELIIEAARPFPRRRRVRDLAERYAGTLAPLFPSLLSPAFAFSTGLSPKQLRAAAAGRLPEGTTLEDVWQTLLAMHNGESDVLGLLHSFGYIRGLQNALHHPEKQRVLGLVDAATRAVRARRSPPWFFAGQRQALALLLAAFRVHLLFLLLAIIGRILRMLGMDVARPHKAKADGSPGAAAVDLTAAAAR